MSAEDLWARWRNRQRIEQFQDNQFYTGHYGYLDSSRRALIYTLRACKLAFDDADIARIMEGWRELAPFPDVLPGLQRLRRQRWPAHDLAQRGGHHGPLLLPRRPRLGGGQRAPAQAVQQRAVAGDTAWVSTVDSTSVTGISARTRSITRSVLLAGRADAVAAGAGSVWVADGRRGVVSRIPQGYERVTQRYRFRPSAQGVRPVGRLRGSRASLAVGADMVWLANGTRRLSRIDPHGGPLTGTAAPARIDAVAAGAGRVWAVSSGSGLVTGRIPK